MTPLQPFAPPAGLDKFGITLSAAGALELLLAIAFLIWLIFSLMAIYHWLKYSHASLLAFPAIFVHLAVSIALMSYALSGSIIPTL